MSTVLCPHLVALNPSSCSSISCRASHNHSPAFCDPCKAVYAEAHTEVHLGSSKHRLRVEAPVAPVRCVICAPLGAEALAQYLFVGPEHYAVHARTSAHRTKLAKLPVSSLAKPTRSKTDSGLGLGRPGSGDTRAFSMERPYAPRAPAVPHLGLTSPPSSRGVTPAPGSRPASSMSFGPGAGEPSAPPPGPPPLALGPSEYVLCALCHVVLPVPPVDVAHKHGSTDPRLRIASGSDVTVRGGKNNNDKHDKITNAIHDKHANDEHDDNTTTVSVLTTTESEEDARKSLVLANHDANDREHARRVLFPKFRSAWDKRAKKEKEKEGRAIEGGEERLAITERGEEEERPPEEQEEREAEPEGPSLDGEDASRFVSADTSILTMSPSQLTLSSLSASPSVAVLGLDDEGEVQYTGEDEEGYPEEERYEGSYEGRGPLTAVEEEDERSQVSLRSRAYAQSSSASSSPPESVVELGGGYAGIRVPAHLLPFLSPLTPATQLEASPESPETPLPAALARVAPFAFPPPPPPLPQNRAATTYAPPTNQPAPTYPPPTNYLFGSNQTPGRGRTLDVPRPRPSPSVSARSQPYEPSPSPPPRLAFDDHGRVIKLGMRGWEVQDPEEEVAKAFSARSRSRSQSAKEKSERDDEEERDERETESEGEGAPPTVSSLSIKRYPIGRNGTIMPPRPDPRPELRPAASAPAVGLQGPAWERGPMRDSLPSFPSNARRASGPITTSLAASLGVGLGIGEDRRTEGHRTVSGGAQRASTMGTQRNVSGSSTSTLRGEAISVVVPARDPAPKAPARGATTTATRPVAARRSTSEWTVLGGATTAPAPRSGPSPQGSRPASRAQTDSRPGSRMNEYANSPDVLSAIGDDDEDRDGYFGSRRSNSGRSSPSEASQVIRALRSVASGVGSVASGVGSALGLRGVEPDNEGDARRRRAMSGSSSGMFGPASPSPQMRSRPHPTTSHSNGSHESPARSFASPTPSRPFSPTLAWKGLTPPSPRSSSSVSDVRSPSLSSVGEGVEAEAEGEFAIKPFDEAQFLADLGFGLGRELGEPATSTGAGTSMGTGAGVGFGSGGQSVSAALSPPVAVPSSFVANPSPPLVAESSNSSPSRLAGSSPPSIPLVRPMSPLLSRGGSPLARGLSSSSLAHGFGTSPPGVVRVSSPLARVAISSSTPGPAPVSSSPVPAFAASPSPVQEQLPAARPATKTRVRTRRMGTSASVVGSVMSGAGPESVISGFGGRSVVSAFDGQSAVGESVVSWAPEPSVVSGAGGRSVVSGAGRVSVGSGGGGTSVVTAPQSVASANNRLDPEFAEEQPVISTVDLAESVVSNAGDEAEDPKIEVLSIRSGSVVSRARSEAFAAEDPTEPHAVHYAESASSKDPAQPVVTAPKSFISENRIRGKSFSLLSVSSDAPSSVVSLLSPRLVAALQASGIEVTMEETSVSQEKDEEVEGIAESLAGMNLSGALPEEEDRIGTIERTDTHSSGFTSPIVPEGAPSAAGSLFSRAVSPKPSPVVPRFSLGRPGDPRSSTPTRAPGGSSPAPATPKAIRLAQGLQNTPGSVRSLRSAAPGSSFERPDSAMAAARVPAPASIFSNRSAAHGAAQVPAPASVFSAGPGGASERRLSVDPAHVPAPGSTFSRGPGSVFSARGKLSGEHRPHRVDPPAAFGSLMGHIQPPVMSQSHSGMNLEPHEAIAVERNEPAGKVAGSPGFYTPAGQASPDVDIDGNQSRTPANERTTPRSSVFAPPSHEGSVGNGKMADEEAGPEDGLEGGLTSSSEEGARDDDDARTATADDDGLDHLTSSIGEPFGHQLDATPGHSPMLEPPAFDPRHANRSRDRRVLTSAPLFESPKHTMMTEPRLPGGFLGEDQPLSASPSLMPPADATLLEVLDDEDEMPEEVLELNPVICDACAAPMPLAKWAEHISKSNHRRNATRYTQHVFQHTTTDRDTSSPSSDPASRKDPAIDARERWVEATRIQPRPARPSEYAFCDTCAVFLVRGDYEHFQGKKHLRCLRAAALDDAAELESVRGSVSDEEDGPAAIRAMREAAGITPDWTKPRMRSRKSIGAAQTKLGQMAFQPVGAAEQNGAGEARPPSDHSVSLIPQSVERGQMGWDMQ
ncbi:hypothetical protein BDV93DRAFT_542938 [Ceratobasidium sp. AG-I]|nr:hypothetical protein BDV93DRAFT_542938 [Ceratobasidium sp. AG-I]